MAKKRKALKPVARGFATVSVPKKPTPSEEPPDVAENSGDTSDLQSSDTPNAPAAPPQADQAVLEEGVLQAIVDKFQDKTEKDILRNIKVWHLPSLNKYILSNLLSLAGDRAGTKIRSNFIYAEPRPHDYGQNSRVGVGRRKD
jgi:hypothetical protein